MNTAPAASAPLPDWLDYIEHLHPSKIDLGLERVLVVARRLLPTRIAPLVITVAGTNGKGSCVHGVARGLTHSGRAVGVYTSPHIERFNERITIAGTEVDDRGLGAAFARVEAARGEVSLSYFEFATLAAFDIFTRAELDAVVLEVGLGGRLDAVNTVDADMALLTSISLDHTQWLGPDREAIGREKVAIARAGRPLVCGDRDLPASVSHHAAEIDAVMYRLGHEFDLQPAADAGAWSWRGRSPGGEELALTMADPGPQIPDNLATILQALALLDVTLDAALLKELTALQIPGRFEWRRDRALGSPVLLDVAHNPGGSDCLARRLQALNRLPRPLIAVFAVMADKDTESMASSLHSLVDIWYIAQFDSERCRPARELAQQLAELNPKASIRQFSGVQDAYLDACREAGTDGLVLVTGSFHTIGAVRPLTQSVAA